MISSHFLFYILVALYCLLVSFSPLLVYYVEFQVFNFLHVSRLYGAPPLENLTRGKTEIRMSPTPLPLEIGT